MKGKVYINTSADVVKRLHILVWLVFLAYGTAFVKGIAADTNVLYRERIPINNDWRFFKYDSQSKTDNLIYDVRPEVKDKSDDKDADSKPTEAEDIEANKKVLKSWILPTGNDFIKNPAKRYTRPEGKPGSTFPFVQSDFDDKAWETVNLPHDWAIKGPFFEGGNPEVGGGMGRLPSPGVAWYRKKLSIPVSDSGKSIFLDVDGAMSYAMVWLNGNLVGGWPYGYNSWRVDLTPYIIPGDENQLAIRLDNPNYSARWYPGGGIYRNVWLVKTSPLHVGQYGVFVRTKNVSQSLAKIEIDVTIENNSNNDALLNVISEIFELDDQGKINGKSVAETEFSKTEVSAGQKALVSSSVLLENPRLWGPAPSQKPNRYLVLTSVKKNNKIIDQYKTPFGIRSLRFDADSGIFVNDELIKLQGVNNHHDLGALGAAFNVRAAERQLEILREMGCNAVRMSHNPPAPELLELTDRMGILVMDEVFDCWERKKTPYDFHLIFPEWHEQDLRSMLRRERNHPSIIMWSYGNEVGEQYTDTSGAAIGKRLHDIIKEEDQTRPTTSAMNWAKSDMPFPAIMDVISFNYQGEGIRQDPIFDNVTDRIKTKPQYIPYHNKFPNKVILSSETASAASSRGVYLFPVTDKISSPIRDGIGGDSKLTQVSSYELYAVDFGSSADKVFASLDHNLFSAGEFVWTGFDYIGEPTPYYENRSSYNGILDLAGFKKDRFYLYQSRWRPELPMAHILPHWNWSERIGKVTPVHVFTSGDEAELFLNSRSLGKQKKGEYEYRLRWDDVIYEPGELKVIAYKNNKMWAEKIVKTTGDPFALELSADRSKIKADGVDLSYITVRVTDEEGLTVPTADNLITFEVDGEGDIVATDNGDPSDFEPFPSHNRKAFSGLALAIIRSKVNQPGAIQILAKAAGLKTAKLEIKVE